MSNGTKKEMVEPEECKKNLLCKYLSGSWSRNDTRFDTPDFLRIVDDGSVGGEFVHAD